MFTPSHVLSPATPDQRRRLPARRLLAATSYFCRIYLQSSQELHRLQSGWMIIPDSHGHPAWLVIPITPSYVERTAYILYVDDDWHMEFASQWDAGANALTLAAISCVSTPPSQLRLSRCHY